MLEKSAQFEAAPAPDEVRAELERILASEPFRPSAQLRVFLRYVTEKTLNGEAERIRAFTIAVEAFGRDNDFDPQSDPIVRVEAARLRRALAQYYAGPGAGDAVEIAVPRGGYVPQFRYRGSTRATAPSAVRRAPLIRSRARKLAAAAALLLACAAVYGLTVMRDRAVDSTGGVAQRPDERAIAEPSRNSSPLPVVLIEPVKAAGGFAPHLEAIRAKLIDALARFDDIVVATAPAAPAAYRLSVTGEPQPDGGTSPTVRLIDAGDGTIVWTRGFERLRAADDLSSMVETVARHVAPTLAQPFGVIHARQIAARSTSGDERYQCLIDAIEFRRTLDPSRHAVIRACLERTIAADPAFPSAQAALAFLTVREFYAGEVDDPKVLAEGLRYALRAVELKPASARAHHVLMTILFAQGDVAAALAEGERALALNPYDMTVYIGYGLRLAFAGKALEGRALLERAAELSPVRPPVLEFALFMANYVLGDHARAAQHAKLMMNEIHPFVLVTRALVAAKAGDREQSQQQIEKLFSLYPNWRTNPRREVERFVPAPHIVEQIVRDLTPVGFGTTN